MLFVTFPLPSLLSGFAPPTSLGVNHYGCKDTLFFRDTQVLEMVSTKYFDLALEMGKIIRDTIPVLLLSDKIF